MNTKYFFTSILLLAIVALCVAGTKIIRLPRTTTFASNTVFVASVGTGSTARVTYRVEAHDLARGLGPWITNSGVGGSATNAQPPSTTLTNLSGTGAITNAASPLTVASSVVSLPLGLANMTTNVIHVTTADNLKTVFINITNNSVVQFGAGTYTVYPSNFALGTLGASYMLVTNKTNVTIRGHNLGTRLLGSGSGQILNFFDCENVVLENLLVESDKGGAAGWTSNGVTVVTAAILFSGTNRNVSMKGIRLKNIAVHGIVPLMDAGHIQENFSLTDIHGDGIGSTNVMSLGSADGSLFAYGARNLVMSGFTVKNTIRALEIYGSASGNAPSNMVFSSGVIDGIGMSGVHVNGGGPIRNVLIADITMTQGSNILQVAQGSYGVHISGDARNISVNNVLSSGAESQGFLVIDGPTNVFFNACKAFNAGGVGFLVTDNSGGNGVSWVSFNDCLTELSGGDGFHIAGGKDITIQNSTVINPGNSEDGIHIYGAFDVSTNVVVRNNYVKTTSGTPTSGIKVSDGSKAVVVENNTILGFSTPYVVTDTGESTVTLPLNVLNATLTAGTYAASDYDTDIIVPNGSSRAVTLPASAMRGRTLVIRDGGITATGTNITINQFFEETINGQASTNIVLNQGSLVLRADGTNWQVIAAAIGSSSAGGGNLSTNANQFGASSVLTIKTNASLTNIVAYGMLNLPSLTASRPAFINASGNLTNATGTPDGTKFLRDDGTLATPAGSGDVTQSGNNAFTGLNTFANATTHNGATTNNSDLSIRRLLTITGTNANGSVVINSHSNNSSSILLQRYRDIEDAPTAIKTGDFLGRLEWLGYGASNLREAVDLRAEAIADFTGTEASTRLNFKFGNNSASARQSYSMDAYNFSNNVNVIVNSNLVVPLLLTNSFVYVGAGGVFSTGALGSGLSWSSPGVLAASAGSGDVFGPSSVTDKQIAVFGGTSGDRLTNSPVTLDPVTGNIANVGNLHATNNIHALSLTLSNIAGSTPAGYTDIKATNGNAGIKLSVGDTHTQTNTVNLNYGVPAVGDVLGLVHAVSGQTATATNIATTGSSTIVRSTSPTITTPVISGGSLIGTTAINESVTTNNNAYVNQTLDGVGGANTNFTGLWSHGKVYIDGGTTNVNFVAFMPGTSGLTYYLAYSISNLTTTARNISLSSVTNRIQNMQQYYGIAAPYVLTNKHTGELLVELTSTNAKVSFLQYTNGF